MLVLMLVLAVVAGTIYFALEISKLKTETTFIKKNFSTEQQSDFFSHQQEHSQIESVFLNNTQQLNLALSAMVTNLSRRVEMNITMLEELNSITQESLHTALI